MYSFQDIMYSLHFIPFILLVTETFFETTVFTEIAVVKKGIIPMMLTSLRD